jgi:hypothetical protein
VKPASENNDDICANHEDCGLRTTQIKLTKGFTAKEHVKGHTASSFFQNLENKKNCFLREAGIFKNKNAAGCY